MKKFLPVLFLMILLPGCASIASKSSYPVSFNSNPTDSEIVITDSRGLQIYSGKTPAVVELSSGEGYFTGARYTITLSKKGYNDTTIVLNSNIDGWYWGNLLLGGLIGMLIVDPITGSMWALPEFSNATLVSSTTMDSNNNKELRFALIDDVPDQLLDKLILLN